jgi:hypothetical protein
MQSLYENLPVYKKSLDLTVHIEKIVKNFDRYHRYAIGTDLRNYSRRILVLIARANSKQARIESLEKAIVLLEELRIVIRVCNELGCFKCFRSFEFASKCVIDLLKQCEGWKCQSSKTITV